LPEASKVEGDDEDFPVPGDNVDIPEDDDDSLST
jgi:hypothetical protein